MKNITVSTTGEIKKWGTRTQSGEEQAYMEQVIDVAFRWQAGRKPEDLNALISHFSTLVRTCAKKTFSHIPASIDRDEMVARGNEAVWDFFNSKLVLDSKNTHIHMYRTITSYLLRRVEGAFTDFLRASQFEIIRNRSGSRVARNLLIDDDGVFDKIIPTYQQAASPEKILEDRQQVDRLNAFLTKFSERDQHVFFRRAVQGEGYDEIGKDYKISGSRVCQIYIGILTECAAHLAGDSVRRNVQQPRIKASAIMHAATHSPANEKLPSPQEPTESLEDMMKQHVDIFKGSLSDLTATSKIENSPTKPKKSKALPPRKHIIR